jgi:hypothetical protein
MPRCRLIAPLNDAERAAAAAYGYDSQFFNAVIQGWGRALTHNPDFNTFLASACAHAEALDRAIEKSQLEQDAVVFSGHGIGIGVRGALTGLPERFVELEYCYSGFISTSSDRQTAIEAFVIRKAKQRSSPTLLEFRLPAAFSLFNMGGFGTGTEFEFLIGRNKRFRVVEARCLDIAEVPNAVLNLVLEPVL